MKNKIFRISQTKMCEVTLTTFLEQLGSTDGNLYMVKIQNSLEVNPKIVIIPKKGYAEHPAFISNLAYFKEIIDGEWDDSPLENIQWYKQGFIVGTEEPLMIFVSDPDIFEHIHTELQAHWQKIIDDEKKFLRQAEQALVEQLQENYKPPNIVDAMMPAQPYLDDLEYKHSLAEDGKTLYWIYESGLVCRYLGDIDELIVVGWAPSREAPMELLTPEHRALAGSLALRCV